MIQKQRRQQHNVSRKFSKFMDDQINYQFKRMENLKKVSHEMDSRITHTPQISGKSRKMLEQKATVQPDLAAPAYKRLYYAQPKPQALQGQIEASSPRRPQTARPTFHPTISQASRQMVESKRRGDVVGVLVQDANRRKVDGRKVRQSMPSDRPTSKSTKNIPSPETAKVQAGKSSSDLLLKRFDTDLVSVLEQF